MLACVKEAAINVITKFDIMPNIIEIANSSNFLVMQEASDALSKCIQWHCFDLSGFFSAVGDRQIS